MENEELIIDGYRFNSKREAEEAQKEKKLVSYLRSKTDLSNPNHVIQVYTKLIEKDTFTTIIGYTFLKELQSYIISNNAATAENIPNILIKKRETMANQNFSTKNANKIEYKSRFTTSVIVNFFLSIIIIVMLIIAYKYNDSDRITKLENSIVDKYATWSDELSTKEKALIEREAQIIIRENSIEQESK